MSDPRWLDQEEMRAWRGLQSMQLRLNGLLAHDLAAHSELGYQDYVVLVNITGAPSSQLRLYELGRLLAWEKSRLSRHVDRMVERGLLRKSTCDQDRRGTYVDVTERGRRLLAAAAPSHVEAVRRLFVDHVSRAELAQLAAICERVLAQIACNDDGDIPG